MMSILLTYTMRGTLILVGLTPDGLRLGLNAALCAQHRHSTVEHAQGTLDLNREVNVARGVDDVDAAVPFQKQVVAAEVMVMPRSCSCSIQSMVAVPSWVSPIL